GSQWPAAPARWPRTLPRGRAQPGTGRRPAARPSPTWPAGAAPGPVPRPAPGARRGWHAGRDGDPPPRGRFPPGSRPPGHVGSPSCCSCVGDRSEWDSQPAGPVPGLVHHFVDRLIQDEGAQQDGGRARIDPPRGRVAGAEGGLVTAYPVQGTVVQVLAVRVV